MPYGIYFEPISRIGIFGTSCEITIKSMPQDITDEYPDSKVHGANMGPTWGRQDPGGPHDSHVNLAIWLTTIALCNGLVL